MKTNSLLCIFLIFTFLISGCTYEINCSIQKSESLITSRNKVTSIYYLKPQVSIFRVDGFKRDDYSLLTKSENEMTKNINTLSKKFKLSNDAQLQNILSDSVYILNTLAKRIVNTNEIQQNIFNQISKENENKIVQQLFTIEPNIGYDYSFLSPIIKTELVGLVGAIAIDLKSSDKDLVDQVAFSDYLPQSGYIQYHYIVNVITGKIIYRDIRVFDSKIKPEHLMITIYDSFFLLNKNLKK